MKVLVSARNAEEALQAARAGVHFIDLKEPAHGALGGLPPARIGEIVSLLRHEAPGALVSATIGDWPADALDAITSQVDAVAACGVDYVKVGVVPGPAAPALLRRLGELQAAGRPLVPVFIADHGVPQALVRGAVEMAFPALMLDTADKQAGSLFDAVSKLHLAEFVGQVQASGQLAGLAGALRLRHLQWLVGLAPDFAGFRSAVCAQDRAGAMDGGLLTALVREARSATAVAAV